jgi:hexosaminidase
MAKLALSNKHFMRLLSFLLVLLTTTLTASAQINIIPQPVEMKVAKGYLAIKHPISFIYNADVDKDGGVDFFKDYLQENYGVREFRTGDTHSYGSSTEIFIDYDENYKDEAYELKIDAKGVVIRGNEKGLFYGFQTLIQLLPVDRNAKLQIPYCTIKDYPRFAYRGMHLDVSRHFFPVSFIKKYIDYLALHKLNYFHWHLTDDQGWRIEIKKYPRLTSVGGYRNGTIIGRYPGTGNDGIRYGGYYTQEEVKEVVKYAADRFITVLPEIEMPGHASAAIAAYPELSCFPNESTKHPEQCAWSGDTTGKQVQQTWGVFDDVFCAGKDNTFAFMQDVMDEILPLFPSKIIHVGGDECPKSNWKRCPNCQKRMKDNNLKDEHELQSYFIQRMEKYLNSKGRTLIGWDEILEGGLAPNAMVMSWRGEEGGITAAQQKHKVVMSPGNPVYFDHTQSENEDSVTIGGYNPIEKVYAYDPLPRELNVEEQKYILGGQANLWTEYIKNTRKVEYMVFPRMSALSEILWSPKTQKNWKDFERRLNTQIKRYELWKANYSKALFNLKATVIPAKNNTGVVWQVRSKMKHNICQTCWINAREEFTYTKDTYAYDTITDVNEKGKEYIVSIDSTYMKAGEKGFRTVTSLRNDTLAIIPVNRSTTLIARQEYERTNGKTFEQTFNFNKTTGKKISLAEPASGKYPGDGAFTLVNGVQNTTGMKRSKEFLGFDGTDCIATIDLGKVTDMNRVTAHVYDDKGSWIWGPSGMSVMTSNDGKQFSSVTCPAPKAATDRIVCEFANPVKARYIKVSIQNQGTIPAGYPGEGHKPWLFVDEIEVN